MIGGRLAGEKRILRRTLLRMTWKTWKPPLSFWAVGEESVFFLIRNIINCGRGDYQSPVCFAVMTAWYQNGATLLIENWFWPSPLGKVPQCAHWGGWGQYNVQFLPALRRIRTAVKPHPPLCGPPSPKGKAYTHHCTRGNLWSLRRRICAFYHCGLHNTKWATICSFYWQILQRVLECICMRLST